jgi:hypothetical protein
MKYRTADLEGDALDAAVAMATGCETARRSDGLTLRDLANGPTAWIPRFKPSTNWEHGGPIIERERIEIHPRSDGGRGDHWGALPYRAMEDWSLLQRAGTPLVAAMRAFVASKFGDEVEVPT